MSELNELAAAAGAEMRKLVYPTTSPLAVVRDGETLPLGTETFVRIAGADCRAGEICLLSDYEAGGRNNAAMEAKCSNETGGL